MILLSQTNVSPKYLGSSLFKEPSRIFSQKNFNNINNVADTIKKSVLNQQNSGIGESSIWKTKNPLVIISAIDDPYLNLAIEHHAFLEKPLNVESSQRLVLYNNSKSIIIGKNQNPWKEINFKYLKEHGLLSKVNILRRYSGGGTVIHDKGNVNYSFMTTKSMFDRKSFSKIIVEELNEIYYCEENQKRRGENSIEFGPKYPIMINERGDLVAFSESKQEYKISGSAYKVTKGKSLHHGTMLLNCDVSQFKKILNGRHEKDDAGKIKSEIVDRSVDSKRVKVRNLEMDENLFHYCLINGFLKHFGINEYISCKDIAQIGNGQSSCHFIYINDHANLPKAIYKIADELRSWEHKFGRTPKFEHVIKRNNFEEQESKISMFVEEGYVKLIDVTNLNANDSEKFSKLMKALPVKYELSELDRHVEDLGWKNLFRNTIL